MPEALLVVVCIRRSGSNNPEAKVVQSWIRHGPWVASPSDDLQLKMIAKGCLGTHIVHWVGRQSSGYGRRLTFKWPLLK